MKKLTALLALLLVSAVSYGWVIKESKQDEDVKIIVNDGGSFKEAIKVTGSTGAVTIGASGETATHNVNGPFTVNNGVLGAVSPSSNIALSLDASGGGGDIWEVQSRTTGFLRFSNITDNFVYGQIDSNGGWTLGDSAYGAGAELHTIFGGVSASVPATWDSAAYAFTLTNLETANSFGNTLKIVGGGGAGGVGHSASKILQVTDNAGTEKLSVTGAGIVDIPGSLTLGTELAVAEGGLGGLSKTDGNFVVANGSTWITESGATARTSLGLGTIATQNSNAVSITGGSVTANPLEGTNGVNLSGNGSLRMAGASAGTSCDTSCAALTTGEWACIGVKQVNSTASGLSCAQTTSTRRCLCMSEDSI